MGILPLRLKTGRNVDLRVNKRMCNLCNLNELEDEVQFLLRFTCYIEDLT